MSLKFTGKFCVMTMKNDTKYEEELTCKFKIEMRVAMSTSAPILLADFPHTMAAGHAEDFQIYVLE